ncbi:hypothetical protein ACLKA7_000973 [Drosophila subpalustris]
MGEPTGRTWCSGGGSGIEFRRPGLNGVEASQECELGQFRFSFLGATTQRLRKGMALRLTLGPAFGSTGPRRRAQDRADRSDLAWKHLDPVRGRNFGLFRFLSTDLTRRPGLSDVGAFLE